MIKTAIIALSSFCLISTAAVIWIGHDLSRMADRSVNIVGSSERFTVKEATSLPQRLIGLSLSSDLSPKSGMIFRYTKEAPRSFSMAYTSTNLDILFINANREIFQIERNVKAFSSAPITSSAPAKYVLEIKAGSSLNLRPGDMIAF